MLTSPRELNLQFDPHLPGNPPEVPHAFRSCGPRCHPRIAQFGDSQQVVRSTGYEDRRLRLRRPNDSRLVQPANRLQPAEDVLHPLSFALSDPITLGSRRPTIVSRSVAIVDSGDMRANLMSAQMWNTIVDVVALVGAKRLGVNASAARAGEHRACGEMLGQDRFGHEDVHAQPATVLQEHMPAVAQSGRLAVAFPHQAHIRIGGALVISRNQACTEAEATASPSPSKTYPDPPRLYPATSFFTLRRGRSAGTRDSGE